MQERLKPSNKLRAYWSKKEDDIMFWHPKHKCDGHLLYSFFCHTKIQRGDGTSKTMLEELEDRGFDLKTIKFSIAYKNK